MRKFYKTKKFGYKPSRIWFILEEPKFSWVNGDEKYYRRYSWSEFNRIRILFKMKPTSLFDYRRTFYDYNIL